MADSTSTIKYRTILTAGGNPTGIIQFPDQSQRSRYWQIAASLMSQDSRLEQFGFLEGTDSFCMSGGEFSGNGSLAAAWLIYKLTGKPAGYFWVSGLSKQAGYTVLPNGNMKCDFYGLEIDSKKINLPELEGTLVDLGGIVHFVFDSKFEFINNPDVYKKIHALVLDKLGLRKRSAVGIIWQKQSAGNTEIYPIVWVRDIDSFFYETACGSGTLAVLVASDQSKLPVIQPSGEAIEVERKNNDYSLASQVAEA